MRLVHLPRQCWLQYFQRKFLSFSFQRDIFNVNRFQTALLIGEKCAVLTAEDLGYSGSDLDMKVPEYHAPGQFLNLARL